MTDLHPVIRAEGIGKRFLIGTKADRPTLLQSLRRWATGGQPQRELWALQGIDLELYRGDVLGIIGANGAGKSTLLMLMAKILDISEGRLEVSGKVNPFFQLASGLQLELTVNENIVTCAALLGIGSRELKKKLPEIIEFSGLEKYLYAKLGELSTGLAARVPFTTAIHVDADILLVDEMLSVGDIAFQDRCVKVFRKLIRQGKTLVIVSHNLNLVQRLCPSVLYLKNGKAAFLGSYEDAVAQFTEDMGVSAPAAASQGSDQPIRELQIEIRETGGKILSAIDDLRQLRKKTDQASIQVSSANEIPEVVSATVSGGSQDKASVSLEAVRSWKSFMRISGPMSFADSFLSSVWIAIAAAMSPRSSPLKVGDEVITTAFNYPGVTAALRVQELVPVLTDLNPTSFNLDVDLIERSLTRKTRAVLVSHLAGTGAPMDEISAYCRQKKLVLIELNHYATGNYKGTALGSFGDFGACGLLHTTERPPEWGIFLSRKPVLPDIFSLSEAPARRMVDVLGRIPRISLAGLESSLAACRRMETASPAWQAMQSEYLRFFSRFSDCIRVPTSAGADVNKERFTVVLDPQSSMSTERLAQSLADAGFRCRPYLRTDLPAFQDEASQRLINSRLLLERGVTFDLCERPEEREKFFSAFSSLLHRNALS